MVVVNSVTVTLIPSQFPSDVLLLRWPDFTPMTKKKRKIIWFDFSFDVSVGQSATIILGLFVLRSSL